MNLKDPQWVIALASSITAMGVVVVIIQAWIAARGVKLAVQQLVIAQESLLQAHDMERRKEAIQHMKDWTKFIAKVGTGSKCFAERLSFEKSKLLFDEKSIEVTPKDKEYLERTVPGIGVINNQQNGVPVLSPSQSSLIRKNVVAYLNLLETILAARRHNVADSEMLEEQFTNLVVPKEGKELLPNFRRVAGGVEAFPSTEEFVKEIADKKTMCQPGKSKLGQLSP